MIASPDDVSDPIGSGCVLALALCFFLAGCVLLAAAGPSLGALHAFAAFVVLAAAAAANQLIPVLTRAPAAEPLPVIAAGALFSAGFALLIAGFYGAPTFAAAGIVLSAGALLWVGWTLVRLLAGRAETQTRIFIALAVTAFLGAAVIGASMAFALGGSGSSALLALAPAHAALAILGFATLLVVTISYRFVPMFSLAHNTAYGARSPQWLLLAAIAAVVALLYRAVPLRVALIALFAAAAWIAVTHVRTLASRIRKRVDVSLRYAAAAWSMGLLAALAAIAGTWFDGFGAAAVALALLGWIAVSILGYAYKVAGFLAWQFARERSAGAALPPLGKAVNERLAGIALVLLTAGAVGGACALAAHSNFARAAFAAYGIGGACAAAALAGLAFTYVKVPYVVSSHG